MIGFARYLRAKRSVDDRALNRRVWQRLSAELRGRTAIDWLEIGAGIGTGAERLRDWNLVEPISSIRYVAVEPRSDLLEEARARLRAMPFACGFDSLPLAELAAIPANRGRYDVVTAHAVLDVLELDSSLDALLALAAPSGLLYLPITFDGETIFEPAHAADQAVLAAYHETMESKGSSRTGRRLYHALRARSAEVLEAGSSDWIVHPVNAAYPDDELFFLEFLLETIEGAVRQRVEPSALDAWMSERRSQLEAAALVYCAHQWDVLARKRT